MNTKLILVEGLPGFGKSTTAKFIYDSLVEMKVDTELYLEGDLNHPADYDQVAYFSKNQYKELLINSGEFEQIIRSHMERYDGGYLLPYGKMKYESNIVLSETLFNTVFKHDIYELPFEQNIDLITKRWGEFAHNVHQRNKTHIFECCFIQNPVTIGMVKYNAPKNKVVDYVLKLEHIIEKLNPILIYIEQENLEFSFRKAVKERPIEWYEGFENYYTNQGYGKEQNYKGLEGTLKVLEERQKIEAEIYERLTINKYKIDNSTYEKEGYKKKLTDTLYEIQ